MFWYCTLSANNPARSSGGACACEASGVPSEATLLTLMPIGARVCAPVMLIGRRPGPPAGNSSEHAEGEDDDGEERADVDGGTNQLLEYAEGELDHGVSPELSGVGKEATGGGHHIHSRRQASRPSG